MTNKNPGPRTRSNHETLSGSSEFATQPNSEMEFSEEVTPMSSPSEEPKQKDTLEELTSASEVSQLGCE